MNGSGDEFSSTELQAAYSVTHNIAVMTNFMSAQGGNNTTNNWAKGNYIDGAIGYYIPLGRFGVMEVYGGVGSSSQHHQYENYYHRYKGSSDLTFTKLFLQPSIGLTFKLFDIALSTRICRLNFNKINNQIDTSNYEFNEVDLITQNKTSYLFEPAFTIRGGWKYVKIHLQWVTSKNLTIPNLSFESNNINAGLYFAITKRYRKKIKIK